MPASSPVRKPRRWRPRTKARARPRAVAAALDGAALSLLCDHFAAHARRGCRRCWSRAAEEGCCTVSAAAAAKRPRELRGVHKLQQDPGRETITRTISRPMANPRRPARRGPIQNATCVTPLARERREAWLGRAAPPPRARTGTLGSVLKRVSAFRRRENTLMSRLTRLCAQQRAQEADHGDARAGLAGVRRPAGRGAIGGGVTLFPGMRKTTAEGPCAGGPNGKGSALD
eukprot:351675-Chlamydomonas_euryale.AAC.5